MVKLVREATMETFCSQSEPLSMPFEEGERNFIVVFDWVSRWDPQLRGLPKVAEEAFNPGWLSKSGDKARTGRAYDTPYVRCWSMVGVFHFQEAGDNIAVAVECCDLGRAHHRARCHLPTADKLVLIDARRIRKALMLAQGNTAFQATVYGCMTSPRLELVMQGTALRPARRWVVGKSCYKLSLKVRLARFKEKAGRHARSG